MLRQYQFAFTRRFSRLNWQVPLAIGLTITLWASAFAGIRAGLQSYSPQSVALWRYLTASIVLAAYASVTKMPLPQRRDLPGITLACLIGFTLYSVTLNSG
jgi:drug/metabolite transporter (DMT)-like permease